jgi:2-dehydro-3-deoxyphosphogluconate aldolase/(4S)-4-hydroxy-2-oxoglutarate aldolase
LVEVTLNSQDALRGVQGLRRRFGDALVVGAGTVRTVTDVAQAVEAGAQFLVSPNFDAASVARSGQARVLHLPGVFTPTEVQMAFAAGCTMVKLFPASALGPSYLRALRAPLDDVDFVPVGGVGVTDVADYVQAGAAALGIGSALVARGEQELDALTRRAAQFVAAWRQAQGDSGARN